MQESHVQWSNVQAPERNVKKSYDPLNAREEEYFYDEKTSPLHLSFATLCTGYRPPRFFEPFCYLEIAHQKSLSTLLHAMVFPQGMFYLVDHNPIHVARLRELVAKLGFENVEIIESTLENLCRQKLPLMDYIVCCHQLTRLCSFEEKGLVDILPTLLKPGGLAYFSYDCMPYWAVHRGAIHLMRLAFADLRGTLTQRTTEAIKFLEQAIQEKLTLFNQHHSQRLLEQLKASSPTDIATRFLLPTVWQAKYFAEVELLMAKAKMTYLASADMQLHIIDQGLTPNVQELLRNCQDVTTKELWMDVLLNQSERSDIFGKGSIRATATDLEIFFSHLQLWPLKNRQQYVHEVQLKLGKLGVKRDTYDHIYDEIEKGNAKFIDLSKQFAGRPQEFLANLRVALLLENVAVGLEKSAGEQNLSQCGTYTRELLTWMPHQSMYLISPFLARGIRSSWLELQCIATGDENDPKKIGKKIFENAQCFGPQFELQGEIMTSASSFYQKTKAIFVQYVEERRENLKNIGIGIDLA